MIAKDQKPFSDYDVPSIIFDSKPIYSLPKPTLEMELYPSIRVFDYFNPKPAVVATSIIKTVTPVVVPKVITQPMAGLPPKKTISFTVATSKETLPGANIAVNGIATAQTDGNGRVTLPNIAIDSTIKITYIGYDDYSVIASQVPNKVIMNEGATALTEIKVVNNYKKPSNSKLLWWLAAAAGAFGIYQYSTGSKVVKAKI